MRGAAGFHVIRAADHRTCRLNKEDDRKEARIVPLLAL